MLELSLMPRDFLKGLVHLPHGLAIEDIIIEDMLILHPCLLILWS